MICTNCSFHNPANGKFCQNCGKVLEIRCDRCSTLNSLGSRFCKNCGNPLSEEITPNPQEQLLISDSGIENARLARITAATPTSLVKKMLSASSLTGERRIVTALFADVVGSTSLAEQLDPEDWTGIMNHAFDQLTPVIYRYEGTIARLMGDALLAFFGAPVAHEDDPIRAVRAALDMIHNAKEYAEVVRRQFGIDFAIRVGLNTGPVVVGPVGTDLVYEYTAMGDAVNLASRMQTAARPMSTFISENTYRFVSAYFNMIDLGPIMIRGKAEPVRAYEVESPRAQPEKTRGIAGRESPMVGRRAELSTLIHISQTLQGGIGRLAVIIGEPGMGKTRLINEWSSIVNVDDEAIPQTKKIRWYQGRCLSYGQGIAYHLLQDLLRTISGVSPSYSLDEMQFGLSTLISSMPNISLKEIYPYLGHLLSLPLDDEAQDRIRMLDPQGLHLQYFLALRQLFVSLARIQPTIVVLEDIHWADPSSVELINRLLPLSLEVPLLFCCVSRPERDSPGWRLITTAREVMGPSLVEINLQPLTETDSYELVSKILEMDTLPEPIWGVILNKAEGNPFFVEEVIRMLIDHGAIQKISEKWELKEGLDTLEIPDNLQGLLLARIDRLPEDVKHTLRVAAVIGRQFSVRVLEEVLQR